MYTIALLAQKGGTGKTTLAVHVAADFEGAGGSAAVIDLDPQASAALWGDRRGRSPFVGAVPAARRSGAGLVVIDTAPHSESAALAAAPARTVRHCSPGRHRPALHARLASLRGRTEPCPAARQDDGSRRGRRARLRGRGRAGPHRGTCGLRALPAPGPVRGGGVPPQQGGWRDPRLRSVAAPPHGRPKCLRLTTPSRACSRASTARPPPRPALPGTVAPAPRPRQRHHRRPLFPGRPPPAAAARRHAGPHGPVPARRGPQRTLPQAREAPHRTGVGRAARRARCGRRHGTSPQYARTPDGAAITVQQQAPGGVVDLSTNQRLRRPRPICRLRAFDLLPQLLHT